MANKKAILNQLADYFADKGMMTPSEYKAADDAPMRFMVAKRAFGSWARMIQMVEAKKATVVVEAPKPAPKPKAKPAPKKAVKKGK